MAWLDDTTREAALIALSNKATATGGATGVLGWLMSLNWLGLCGALVAVVGLVSNVYFLWRRDRREAAESKLRIAALKSKVKP